jgi:hypothetical protein
MAASSTCGDCLYHTKEASDPTAGFCRRYPPQFSYQAGVGFSDLKQSMIWPVTYDTEWCGEWKQGHA